MDEDKLNDSKTFRAGSGDEYISVNKKYIKGAFRDFMMVMENEMNLTTDYIRRHDLGWGNKLPNGTFTGMISSVLKKDADIIGASLTLKPVRFDAVNYLFPIGTETEALVIKRTSNVEDLDWTTFLLPFARTSWQALLILSLLSVSVIKLMELYYSPSINFNISVYQTVEDVFMYYWLLLCSYFGKPPPKFQGDNNFSFKLAVFIIFFAGNVIFMMYKASLTSELSKRSHKKPFERMEDLLSLDFK